MDYISFIGGFLLLYLLVLKADCASIPARQKRQSLSSDPDRIFFQDEFEQYKNQLKYAQIDDSDKRFGLDEETIKQLEASANKKGKRNKRQMMPGFSGGFNDISRGGGGFGMFPGFFPASGDDNDVRPVWDITPSTTSRPARQQQQRQESTTLPGPPTWATPPSQCVRNCQITPQYNPVCGTDGITYTNLGRLQCEVRCGKSIQLNHYGNCSRTTTQAPSSRRSAPSSRRRRP